MIPLISISDCSDIAKELFLKIMEVYKQQDTKIQQTFFIQILDIVDPQNFFGGDIRDWLKGKIETYIANYSSTISYGDILPLMVGGFV